MFSRRLVTRAVSDDDDVEVQREAEGASKRCLSLRIVLLTFLKCS